MKTLIGSKIQIALLVPALLFAVGCGSSSTEPAVSSSQDEMTNYLEEHPELKDVQEDTVTASGGV